MKVQMKGIRLFLVGLLALSCLAVEAAGSLRYNYKRNGYTYVSSDYERIEAGGTPFWLRTESILFPDGTAAWFLYLNFESPKAQNVPKGVKMAATLPNGKLVRLDQIGTDNATKRAMHRDKETYYLNRTKYMVEPGDMSRLCAGVKALDVVTGWDPDDYVQLAFSGDEFAKALSAQAAAVKAAGKPVELSRDLAKDISRHADSKNSLMVVARPETVRGASMAYNVGLTYLYYKGTDKEDFDFSVQIGTEKENWIPLESEAVFGLADGSEIVLRQTRDESNHLFLYPTVADVRRMIVAGVKSITVRTGEKTFGDTFDGRVFSEALGRQYQLLMSVSPK